MTSCTGSAAAQRILGVLKKSVELKTRHQTRRVDFCLLAEARPVAFVAGATRVGGGGRADGKTRIERMCISLLMSKNL